MYILYIIYIDLSMTHLSLPSACTATSKSRISSTTNACTSILGTISETNIHCARV